MKILVSLVLFLVPALAQESQKSLNADVIAARAANKDLRYADAEALMVKDTAASPTASLMWMELGAAELGLKKYAEAEIAFKRALGTDAATQKAIHQDDFFTASEPGATHASRNTAEHAVLSNEKLNPEIVGAAYSDLGEIYARTKRTRDAQAAWDSAAGANPTKAAFYRGNEAIIFYQEGEADAQVKAAEKAIALDPARAVLYYFKGQGLASKATVDPQTQKMTLPPECLDAYRKYLELEPKGKFAEEAKQMIAVAGSSPK